MSEEQVQEVWQKPFDTTPPPSPIPMRECACGCGYSFQPSRRDKIYLNNTHANYGYNHGQRKKKMEKIVASNKQLKLNDQILENHFNRTKGKAVAAFLINLKADGFDTRYFVKSEIKDSEHYFILYHYAYSIYEKDGHQLTKIYKLDKIPFLENYINYEEIKKQWDLENKKTYNPQKTKGKPYFVKGNIYKDNKKDVYGQTHVMEVSNISGDRHPTSILKFNNPQKSDHPTQKPIDLLEWLIKTYSNENDLICDFTMGSGSTGVACKNTNRYFIGVELNKDYFDIAKKRIY